MECDPDQPGRAEDERAAVAAGGSLCLGFDQFHRVAREDPTTTAEILTITVGSGPYDLSLRFRVVLNSATTRRPRCRPKRGLSPDASAQASWKIMRLPE